MVCFVTCRRRIMGNHGLNCHIILYSKAILPLPCLNRPPSMVALEASASRMASRVCESHIWEICILQWESLLLMWSLFMSHEKSHSSLPGWGTPGCSNLPPSSSSADSHIHQHHVWHPSLHKRQFPSCCCWQCCISHNLLTPYLRPSIYIHVPRCCYIRIILARESHPSV